MRSILLMSLGDLTWDLGRQTYIADEMPVHLRARAMSLFGGTMRVGRILGPLLGAGLIAVGGAAPRPSSCTSSPPSPAWC